MSDNTDQDDEDARLLAEKLGLNNLSKTDLRQLLKSSKIANERRSLMQIDHLTPVDEPAHIFRLN